MIAASHTTMDRRTNGFRCISLRRLIFALLALGITSPFAIAGDRSPVFDAHVHYNGDARDDIAPSAVFSVLNAAGISRALVSSTPNDGTLVLHQQQPARIVPALRPYRHDGDRRSWFRDPAILSLIERELTRDVYRAIGEFHLHGDESESTVLRRIVALAVEHGLVLHAHSDEAAILALFKINADATVLWAHAGMSAGPASIQSLLERYPRLWVELSLRGVDIAPGGRLDPTWRALFLQFPTRFLLGTDTWTPERWNDVTVETNFSRRWLSELPETIAAAIANGNAAKLFPP